MHYKLTAILLSSVLATILATAANATHLLHEVPKDIGETAIADCKEQWPNSQFNVCWCVDKELFEWMQANPDHKKHVEAPIAPGNTAPGLIDNNLPDLIIRDKPDKDNDKQ